MTKKQTTQPAEPIVSYKGFDQKLQCRDHQFVVGETYEHKGAVKACEGGFHACEYPLHVFAYYKPSRSRFAVVEQSGKLDREDGDNKVASSRLTIKAELDLAGLIKAAIKYTMDRCTPAEGAVSDQDNESVSANGVRKAATASGYGGAATASGDSGAATASGNSGAATASGNSGAATASGDYGAATASCGNCGAATASGYGGAATASGDYGAAMASGRNGKASGKNGCALFLVRRDSQWRITHAFAGIVGRDGLQADTFYTLDESGKPVEAK